MEEVIKELSNRVPEPPKEYVDEQGITRCKVCGKRTKRTVTYGNREIEVRCVCDCGVKEIREREEREKEIERNNARMTCFNESNMQDWNFANDDKENEKLSDVMRRYCENFKQLKKDGKGLLLYGSVGTGKTYYAACIANELIDNDYDVLMTNFAKITNKMQGMFDKREEYISSLNRYSLLIIDDLGAERRSEYMQEMVFNIIDSRYRAGLPLVITTNLSLGEIVKAKDIGYSRIYDRILERCLPIEVNGTSRRREKVKDTYREFREVLGI